MTEAIKAKSAEDREKFNDLLKAIATSTILSTPSHPGGTHFSSRIKMFNKWNEGGLVLKDINEK